MINTPDEKAPARPKPDRAALRTGLLETQANFHQILNSVRPERWRQKSPCCDWSVAEVFVHLTWALEYLPKEVARARQGRGMFNMPKGLADSFSYWYIRLLARKSTPETVQSRYDAAMAAAIKALEAVPDSDWELSAKFYGEGFYTVTDLFQTPAHHLAEHTAGL